MRRSLCICMTCCLHMSPDVHLTTHVHYMNVLCPEMAFYKCNIIVKAIDMVS